MRPLYNNTTGSYNTATGALALTFNTTATATRQRFEALYSNTGTANTAIGDIALFATQPARQHGPAV